ncbi:MAG: HAMP domain-containing histidine kinase [Bdellovibrionaceae bacterium]|nr:HAMP domain-containing histidine kinase [Pseudobdellovibrionaceae bacterium]
MPASRMLTRVVEELSHATDIPSITNIVTHAAREIASSEGATFVLRDNDNKCNYVSEDAISPLWKGKRFSVENSISGWCMNHNKVVTISDIYQDDRIHHDVYKPTFVKSLCMIPISTSAPVGAIGVYWSNEYTPTAEEIKFLQILANSSATSIENFLLKEKLLQESVWKRSLTHRHQELEVQLHSLAHDMKSPLNTIMGLAELLQIQTKNNDNEKSRQYIESILKTGRRLDRQIDKILALYRLSNQSLEKKRIDLSELVTEILDLFKAQYPHRCVEFHVGKNLETFADPDLIRIAIENLISNAFKYSSRKNTTWICFDKCPDQQYHNTFYIEDHGVGFDPQKANELFKPLARLHDQRDFQGTGLGLASVARIIELHDGTVAAKSEPLKGSTFYFSLPATY